jgi:tRNA G10  N-methylase Trm11
MTNRYLFVLGRNPELSRAEVISYLEAREIKFKIISERDNLLLIESEIDERKAINSLGGTIAIGRVFVSGDEQDILSYLEKNPIYFGEENKFQYSISNFSEIDIEDAVKENFKKERLKAVFKKIEIAPDSMKNLHNYFIIDDNFGVIEEIYDTEEAEKRDMEKPVRRSRLAISPRLARILINLSGVKEGETLLDPFCGIGVILQEAVLQGINCIGVDIDRKAIEGAKRNLNWLKEKYKTRADYKLVNKDSGRVILRGIHGIACEPNLGMLLKRSPNPAQALEIMRKFESTISFVFTNLKYSLVQGGKIAFTSPLIRAGNNRIGCSINRIIEKAGLRLISKFKEEREGKIVSREVFVLERS